MSLVAVVGDATTTTTLALAASWPATAGDVLVVELDRRGGSMAAWLDLPATPSLTTVVTRAATGGWPEIRALTHDARGMAVIPAPVRTLEAARAVSEAERHVAGVLAALDDPVALADLGAPVAADGLPPVVGAADVALVVHRQRADSARSAAVRVERTAELVEVAAATGVPLALAVIGDAPFDPDEVAAHVLGATPDGPPRALVLADDPLAAAVLAGRTGVSARRMARLPLMRSARAVALAVDALRRDARRQPEPAIGDQA